MTYKFSNVPQKRSKLMQKIKSTDTKPEVALRKLLWSRGVRYRKNNEGLLGKPDICILKQKIAIFIDGEFWHGFDWKNKKQKIKTNREYWIPKIEKNIERDKKIKLILENEGWTVLRIWESEIKKNPAECLRKVLVLVGKVKRLNNERI